MSFEVDMAIELIQDAAASDIESCERSIRSGDNQAALTSADQAMSKLSIALDALRALRREAQPLGVVLI